MQRLFWFTTLAGVVTLVSARSTGPSCWMSTVAKMGESCADVVGRFGNRWADVAALQAANPGINCNSGKFPQDTTLCVDNISFGVEGVKLAIPKGTTRGSVTSW